MYRLRIIKKVFVSWLFGADAYIFMLPYDIKTNDGFCFNIYFVFVYIYKLARI